MMMMMMMPASGKGVDIEKCVGCDTSLSIENLHFVGQMSRKMLSNVGHNKILGRNFSVS